MAETETELEPQSIKSRIAALNLEKVHAPTPGAKPIYTYDAVDATKKKPPPPPPPARPPQHPRQQTVNNPPLLSHVPTSARHLGNQPVEAAPPTPKISPAHPPPPPPRTGRRARQSPPPPPRPPPDRTVSRRESSESISTIASGISTLSLGSVQTNASSGGTLYQVRAPAYDASKLPPLPAKKAEEKSATRQAMTSKRNYVPSHTLPPQLKTSPPGEYIPL